MEVLKVLICPPSNAVQKVSNWGVCMALYYLVEVWDIMPLVAFCPWVKGQGCLSLPNGGTP